MEKQSVEPGMPAPAFSLPDEQEHLVSLHDLAGSWLVLYFYPKDNTSGCTTEAIEFTALKDEFARLGARIIGVSPDSCKSHQGFILKQGLGITLLSDPEKKALKAYGVWQKKSMYGREYYGVVRTTVLIDPTGIIRARWDRVAVTGHAGEVLQKLAGMNAS